MTESRPEPKADDTFIRSDGSCARIFSVSGGMVYIMGQPDRPFEIKNLTPARSGEANTWELVGVSSTDMTRF